MYFRRVRLGRYQFRVGGRHVLSYLNEYAESVGQTSPPPCRVWDSLAVRPDVQDLARFCNHVDLVFPVS